MKFQFIVLLYFVVCGSVVLADHPQEGNDSLPSLVNEALANNPLVNAKAEEVVASESAVLARKSQYYPEFKFLSGRSAVKDNSLPNATLRTYGQIDAKVNLYQGGQTNADVAIYETQRDLATEEKSAQKLEIASNVALAFYDLMYSIEGLSVIEKVFSELYLNKGEAIRRINSGQVARSESIQFELLESQLKTVRAVFQEKEVELNQRLRFLTARSDSLPLKIKGHLLRQRWAINLEDITTKALKFNNEILREQLKVRLLESKVKAETGKFLPSIDAKGSYGRLASDVNPNLGQLGWSAEVILTMPLFDGMNTLRSRDSALHSLSAQNLESSYAHKKVRQEVRDLVNHFASLDARLSVEDIALQKANELLAAVKSEYRRGIKDSSSLAGATQTLLTTEIGSLELKRDWYITKVKLLTLTGDVVVPQNLQ